LSGKEGIEKFIWNFKYQSKELEDIKNLLKEELTKANYVGDQLFRDLRNITEKQSRVIK
jgi:hypothetical protein